MFFTITPIQSRGDSVYTNLCRRNQPSITGRFVSPADIICTIPHIPNLQPQKYGHVAFDTAQKAVLTSCVLRYKPSPSSIGLNSAPSSISSNNMQMKNGGGGGGVRGRGKEPPLQERFINCCFSFTIQRDLHGIPTLIAGKPLSSFRLLCFLLEVLLNKTDWELVFVLLQVTSFDTRANSRQKTVVRCEPKSIFMFTNTLISASWRTGMLDSLLSIFCWSVRFVIPRSVHGFMMVNTYNSNVEILHPLL